MFTVKNILNEFSSRNYRGNYNLICYIKISEQWEQIVGETLSSICHPAFYLNNTLTIKVKDSAWANEILMKQIQIFKNIRKHLSIEVTSLRTQIGTIEKNNSEYQNIIKKIESRDMTENENKWIDDVMKVSDIEDSLIKEKFANILKIECIKNGD
jgi:hypothetical protein